MSARKMIRGFGFAVVVPMLAHHGIAGRPRDDAGERS
jgi:hypothetical protein